MTGVVSAHTASSGEAQREVGVAARSGISARAHVSMRESRGHGVEYHGTWSRVRNRRKRME